MKIAWLFPVNQRCGISFYSHEYVKALKNHITVDTFDIDKCLSTVKRSATIFNNYDCVHIQYETSFFLKKNSNRFKKLCSLITRPIIVSLHEVYREFPDVFPRSQIKGRGFIRQCKELLYDFRHPYQTMYTRHVSESFLADKILVHAQYHKNILVQNGISKDMLSIIPLPVKPVTIPCDTPFMASGVLRLCSHGFITPHFDYPLLFAILDNLAIPWHFSWLGGIRRDQDTVVLNAIKEEVTQRKWQDKFIITGWITENERDRVLSQTDLYLALFTARGSSASLAAALGARSLIIATELPLTSELVEKTPILSIVPSECTAVIDQINRLASDTILRNSFIANIESYIKNHSYTKHAGHLIELYQDTLT